MTERHFDQSTLSWVMTEPDVGWLLDAIATATTVVIDLETTGLDEHAVHGGQSNEGFPARVVLAALTLPQPDDTDEPTTWILPLSHPDSPWLGQWRDVLRRVAQTILDAERPVWNQNVKFDARWIYALTGVDLSERIAWDTQISSHLLDENSSTKLKERAPDTFGIPRWDDFDLTYPGAAEEVPIFDLGLYAARDTYWTWRLAELHRRIMFLDEHAEEPFDSDEIEHARLGKLATWVTMPTTASLTAMEQRGICLDVPWVAQTIADHQQTVTDAWERLAGRYPECNPDQASFAPTSIWFREWAEAAVKAGDLIVAALTPTGKPQWSGSVLVRQARHGSEVATDLLDLRRSQKRLEYLRSWLTMVTPEGRIHANYNAGSVVTGRLSSSGPNMQQVTAALKPAFVPTPGHVFVDLDYSQIELRVAAFISRSEPMIEAFQRGEDLHTRLAARITGKPESEVTPSERQAGKSANFGLLYLMGAYGFRLYAEDVYDVVFTQDEANDVHRAFFETWDGIAQWHTRTIERVRRTGQVVSPIGRVRRLPQIWWSNAERVAGAERAAVNSPVQGFASDLMQMAAASIGGYLPGTRPVEGARIVATVHDSILVEAPEDRWREVGRECQRRMVEVPTHLTRMGCHLDVPLVADATVGTRWGLRDLGTL